MKKLESFLYKYSWLLKSGIWVLLIFWASQLGHVFVVAFEREAVLNKVEPEIQETMNRELLPLLEKMLEKAEVKGPMYGPEDYFNDLKTIELKKYEIGKGHGHEPPFFSYKILELQRLTMANTDSIHGMYTSEQLGNAVAKYDEWKRSGGAPADEFHKEMKVLSLKEMLCLFLNWVMWFYLKGLFLVSSLFIVRMSTRRGILETILADKLRFIYSVILWPLFLSKYPHNVIKEIVVEAELRRIGNVFRKFTSEETQLVRQVAETHGLWQWIRNFRLTHSQTFERSFASALLFTIVLQCVAPVLVQASITDLDVRAGPEIIQVGSDEDAQVSVQQDRQDMTGDVLLFGNLFGSPPKLSGSISFFWKVFRAQRVVRKIRHIPLSGCLFVRMTIVQTN